MKKKIIINLICFISILFCFSSCNNAEPVKKYSVWLVVESIEQFEAGWGERIEHNHWIKKEITDWEQANSFLTENASTDGRHNLSLGEIQSWLLSKGFSDVKSVNAAGWLTQDVDHGLIAFRNGDSVYYVIK